MAKIGPKEEQLRALKARRIETSRASVPAKTAAPAAQPKETIMSKKSKNTKKPAAPKPKKRSVSEAAANLKAARAASKAAAKAAAKSGGDGFEKAERAEQGPRAGSKTEVVANLLKRPEGCTTKDVLTATGWPTVSMPQQAKAAGLTLRKEKDGKVSRYFGAAA